MKAFIAFMKSKSLFRYKVGLAVLLILSLIVVVVVLVRAGDVRHDKDALKKSQAIATKLNTYISNNNKIPKDLAEADIKDVPDAVSYQRLSDKKYQFCVNYKTETSLRSLSPSLTSTLNGAMTASSSSSSQIQGLSADDYSSSSTSSRYSSQTSTLTVSSYHKKGKDCKTIEPYLRSSSLQRYLDRLRSSDSSSSVVNSL